MIASPANRLLYIVKSIENHLTYEEQVKQMSLGRGGVQPTQHLLKSLPRAGTELQHCD